MRQLRANTGSLLLHRSPQQQQRRHTAIEAVKHQQVALKMYDHPYYHPHRPNSYESIAVCMLLLAVVFLLMIVCCIEL